MSRLEKQTLQKDTWVSYKLYKSQKCNVWKIVDIGENPEGQPVYSIVHMDSLALHPKHNPIWTTSDQLKKIPSNTSIIKELADKMQLAGFLSQKFQFTDEELLFMEQSLTLMISFFRGRRLGLHDLACVALHNELVRCQDLLDTRMSNRRENKEEAPKQEKEPKQQK